MGEVILGPNAEYCRNFNKIITCLYYIKKIALGKYTLLFFDKILAHSIFYDRSKKDFHNILRIYESRT